MFITQKKLDERIANELMELKSAFAKALEKERGEIEAGFKAAIEAHLTNEKELRYESEEPFVSIIGEREAADGSVELVLDWNKAFIRKLRRNGYSGGSDDAMVNMWLSTLSRQIQSEMADGSFK